MDTARTSNVPAIVLVVLGVAFAVLVATVAGPCVHDDGSVSACSTSGNVLLGMGVAVAVIALARIFVPAKGVARALGVAAAVLGVAIAVVPGTFTPLCMMETMHCRAVMQPTAMVCGALVAIVAIVDIVRTARS